MTISRHFLQAYKFVFLHFYIPISETYISLFLFLDPANSASFWVECCQSLPSCSEGLLARLLLHTPAINRFPLTGTWWSGLPQRQRQPWFQFQLVIFFLAVTRITIWEDRPLCEGRPSGTRWHVSHQRQRGECADSTGFLPLFNPGPQAMGRCDPHSEWISLHNSHMSRSLSPGRLWILWL